jgi:hypothetical protein
MMKVNQPDENELFLSKQLRETSWKLHNCFVANDSLSDFGS